MRGLLTGLASACMIAASVSADEPSAHTLLERAKAGARSGQSTSIVVRLTRPGRSGSGSLVDFLDAAREPSPARDVEAAHACGRFLDRVVGHDITGWPLGAAVLAFGAASGQDAPAGVAGTCRIDALSEHARRVRVSRAATVRAALDVVVAEAPGVAWLAIEGVDGACGVGFYGHEGAQARPASPSGIGERFCMVQLGNVPPSRARRQP